MVVCARINTGLLNSASNIKQNLTERAPFEGSLYAKQAVENVWVCENEQDGMLFMEWNMDRWRVGRMEYWNQAAMVRVEDVRRVEEEEEPVWCVGGIDEYRKGDEEKIRRRVENWISSFFWFIIIYLYILF